MVLNNKKYPILSIIDNPKILRKLPESNLTKLCKELRRFFLESISNSSGHFASGLGTIELTVAIHYSYNTPFDKIIWDTGHQAYPHKILTGRKDKIFTIRKKNGLHPFPCREESEYDVLSVGHSSTSISAGLGIAIAAQREKLNRKTVCIIGDGAITAGMAFEAINHAGHMKHDLLIILNDNNMSISENVGAIHEFLNKILIRKFPSSMEIKKRKIFSKIFSLFKKRKYEIKLDTKSRKILKLLFKKIGFKYNGPIYGHDVNNLVRIIKSIRKKNGPNVLHVVTKKGFGYLPAEKDPIGWHFVQKFDLQIGNIPKKKLTYSNIFGDWLCSVAKNDKKLIAITPAMCEGSGMLEFSRKYPNQYFDVAIAEQHSVTFAAGLAISGYRPIVAIYSTFLQRAYDQLIHDVAMQKLPILFAIDRGGIVGSDGKTHHGLFDLSFLRCIPNMIIMTPSDENECRLMLHTGYFYKNGPCAVRYPKGIVTGMTQCKLQSIPLGKGVIYFYGKKIAILNFGVLLSKVKNVAKILNATLVDMRFVKPLDEKLINKISSDHNVIITVEENVIMGGAGSGVNEYVLKKKLKVSVLNIGLPDQFINHGNQEEIQSDFGLDTTGILHQIKNWLFDQNIKI